MRRSWRCSRSPRRRGRSASSCARSAARRSCLRRSTSPHACGSSRRASRTICTILLRDHHYPRTWWANLLASSGLYASGGAMWSLRAERGGRPTFAFLRRRLARVADGGQHSRASAVRGFFHACGHRDARAVLVELPRVTSRIDPDLLHPIPRSRIDVEHTKLAVSLAFASGVSGGLFADALDRATVAPSTWEPAVVRERSLPARSSCRSASASRSAERPPRSRRSTSSSSSPHPPSDRAIVEHRRAILRRARRRRTSCATRSSASTSLLRQLRALLEGATGIGKWDREPAAARHPRAS